MTGDAWLFTVVGWALLAYFAVSVVQLTVWHLRNKSKSKGDACEVCDDGIDDVMECPRCKEIAYSNTGTYWDIEAQREVDEYECTECGMYATWRQGR